MIKSNSYKESEYKEKVLSPQKLNYRTFKKQQSLLILDQNSSPTKPNQPELQSQELFFQASLKYARKKKIDHYFLFFDQLIGQGSFAKVYKGLNILTNEIVAIKVMQMKYIAQKKLYALLQAEIQIFKSLKHPNVLRCYDILITDNNCYIITELCNNGELKQFISKQKQLKLYDPLLNFTLEPLIYDIYQGLLYLQRKNIIHRDIKMSNILVKDGKAKIADFGFAIFSIDIFTDVRVGSPIYMAPQAFIKNMYSSKTDVWAFGILLFQFYHGYSPYQKCRSNQELEQEIVIPFKKDKIKAPMSQQTMKLICNCLTYDWKQRPMFKQLWTSNYIKDLRFKSYVELKQLNFYKETATQKEVQKSKSDTYLEVYEKNYQQKHSDEKINNESTNNNNQEGYSFEDFLKLSQQNESHQNKQLFQQKNLLNLPIKNEEKINYKNQQICQKQKQEQETKQLKFQQAHPIKQFSSQMEQFYRQAQQMMNNEQSQKIKIKQDLIGKKASLQQKLSQACIQTKELQSQNFPQNFEVEKQNIIQKQNVNIIQPLNLDQNKKIKDFQLISEQITKIKYQLGITKDSSQQKDINQKKLDTLQQKQISPKRNKKIKLQKNYCYKLNSSVNLFPKINSLNQLGQEIILPSKLNSRNQDINQKQVVNRNQKIKQQSQQKSLIKQRQTPLQLKQKSFNTNNEHKQVTQKQKKVQIDNILNQQNINKTKQQHHNQNLQKFWNLLKTQQSKADNCRVVKKSKKQIIAHKQTQQIDQIFNLLQFSRFIVKYLRFTDKLSQTFKNSNVKQKNQHSLSLNNQSIEQSYSLIFTSIQLKKQVLIQEQLFYVCQQVIMKKISETIVILNSQKDTQLLQIVKTHKNLLKYIKDEHVWLVNYKRKLFTKQSLKQLLEQIFRGIKIIQQPVTKYNELKDKQTGVNNNEQVVRKLCWIGLWLSKIYDIFIQIDKLYINRQTKLSNKQGVKQGVKLIKQMQSFMQYYQSVLDKLDSQYKSENQNVTKENRQVFPNLQQDINYFFQLVYQIELKRMNLLFD